VLVRVVVATAIVAALVLAGAWAIQRFDLLDDPEWDGSEERPPIIVRNGSILFENGDPSDSSTLKSHWHDWAQDLTTPKWKPDHDDGYHVNSYQVTTTGVIGCSPLTGREVTINYTLTDNSVKAFTFAIQKKFGMKAYNRKEPKLNPGNVSLTATPMDVANNVPARLTFAESGYISKVFTDTNATGCSFGSTDRPKITIVGVH